MLLANVSALRKTNTMEKVPAHSMENLPITPKSPIQDRKSASLNLIQTAALNKFKWAVTVLDAERFGQQFTKIDTAKQGFVDKETALQSIQSCCGTTDTPIRDKIWSLSDRDTDNQLDKKEFTIAMFLAEAVKLKAQTLPDELSTEFINSVYRGNVPQSTAQPWQTQLKRSAEKLVNSSGQPETQPPPSDFRNVLKKDPSGGIKPTNNATPSTTSSGSSQVDFRGVLKKDLKSAPSSNSLNKSGNRASLPDHLSPIVSITVTPISDPQKLKEELDKEEEELRREEEELRRQEEELMAALEKRGTTINVALPPPIVIID